MSKFQQGYACAVAVIIRNHGEGVETREALEAAGLSTLEKLKEANIDPYDIEILTPTVNYINELKEAQRNIRKR